MRPDRIWGDAVSPRPYLGSESQDWVAGRDACSPAAMQQIHTVLLPGHIKAPLCSLSHVKRPLSECKLNLS